MFSLEIILILIFFGCLSGFFAGLLGAGGGMIIVPSLFFAFKLAGYSNDILMHLAVGTSLAIIFPTSCESFGLPVLEAASKKVPILCSNLKVFKEIYGKGCFYFDYQNYRSILKKIYYFSSLKEKEIKKKIEINYNKTKKLNWEYCGNNYYQMIINILNFYEKKN